MDRKGYDFLIEEEIYYTFISSGKKGDIAKVVIFQELTSNNYNLVLADYDVENKVFSDNANNGDMPKVMATILKIILNFLSTHPNSSIMLEGNSVLKNRLYNRIVKNYYPSMSSELLILVEANNTFEEYDLDQDHNKFYLYKRMQTI